MDAGSQSGTARCDVSGDMAGDGGAIRPHPDHSPQAGEGTKDTGGVIRPILAFPRNQGKEQEKLLPQAASPADSLLPPDPDTHRSGRMPTQIQGVSL